MSVTDIANGTILLLLLYAGWFMNVYVHTYEGRMHALKYVKNVIYSYSCVFVTIFYYYRHIVVWVTSFVYL